MKITVEYDGTTTTYEVSEMVKRTLKDSLDSSPVSPARRLGELLLLEAARELSRQAKQLRDEVYPPLAVADRPNVGSEFLKAKPMPKGF